MLKINFAYVTQAGLLEGVITRERLREYLNMTKVHPRDHLADIAAGCCCCG
jgi:hypothetical protein